MNSQAQYVADAVAEELPFSYNVYRTEIIDALEGWTIHARIGRAGEATREIAGIGDTFDLALEQILAHASSIA